MSRLSSQNMCSERWQAVVLWCGILFSAFSPARCSQLTNVQTVFLIVMENKDWAGLHGNADCPYLNNTLLPMASRAEQYFTPTNLQPSEPNYIWLEAGTNFGILNDDSPDINHISSTNHLVTLLENAGISWKTYQESYDPTENPKTDKGPYAAKHNPFIFFDDIATNATRRTQHIRPYSELAADLRNNTVARYNFIVPNLTNDMHSLAHGSHSKEKQGDNWLAHEVPAILSSQAYTNNGALVLVWDEDHNGPIGLIILSPLAKGNGYMNRIHYTHSSLLRTLQEIFRVRPLLGDAANATDLSDLFSDNGLKLLTQHTPSTSPPRVTVTGLTPGRTNMIQASTNLIDWFSLRTNVAKTQALPFTDIARTNGQSRFYRVLELR